MSFINDAIKAQLLEQQAQVFFVSGAATKWWNARRSDRKTEIAILGGWYWTLDGEEAGPFRTPSGAWRDCYYRRLLHQKPPVMGQRDLEEFEHETRPKPGRNRRRQSPAGAKPQL